MNDRYKPETFNIDRIEAAEARHVADRNARDPRLELAHELMLPTGKRVDADAVATRDCLNVLSRQPAQSFLSHLAGEAALHHVAKLVPQQAVDLLYEIKVWCQNKNLPDLERTAAEQHHACTCPNPIYRIRAADYQPPHRPQRMLQAVGDRAEL